MTSKNLFCKLIKEDAKRRLWMPSLLMLVFVFLYPVAVLAMVGRYSFEENAAADATFRVYSYVSGNNGMLIFIICVASILCGISSFSYLFSKKKTDFYHALPVKRHVLFLCNYLYGILAMALVLFVNMVLAYLIAVANGHEMVKLLPIMTRTYLFHMTYFMLLYTVVVLAVMMTGTLVISVLGIAVFYLYGPITYAVISGYYTTYFNTFYSFGMMQPGDFYDRIMYITSPLLFYLFKAENYYETYKYMHLFLVIVVTVLLAALSLRLYQRRASEAAGKAMAFEKSKAVIKVLITVVAALGGGLVFWQIRSTTAWAVFGIVASGVLTHCLIEIIYHSDFRKLLAHKLQMFGCILAGLLLFLGFRYDVTGYDSYRPKADEIESAAVYISSLDTWVTYGSVTDDEDYYWNYEDDSSYISKHMKVTDIKNIEELADLGIESLNEVKASDYSYRGKYAYDFAIAYHLKNGKIKVRTYPMSLRAALSNHNTIKTLYQNPEYKRGVFPILLQTPQETTSVYYQEINHIMPVELSDTDKIAELLVAYQDDLLQLSIDNLMTESPIGMIQFRTTQLEHALNESYKTSYYGNLEQRTYYPIYPGFERTIALLKNYDIEPGTVIKPSEITQIIIENTDYFSSETGANRSTYIVSEPKEIEELFKVLIPEDYASLNQLNQVNYDLEISVRWGDGMNQFTYAYCIEKDKEPDWLKEKLNYSGSENVEYKTEIITD